MVLKILPSPNAKPLANWGQRTRRCCRKTRRSRRSYGLTSRSIKARNSASASSTCASKRSRQCVCWSSSALTSRVRCKGTAGRYSDIDLQLFTDDGKSVELFLLNRNIAYDIPDQRHYAGDQARAVPVLKLYWQGVPVNLAIYTLKEERGTLKTTLAGRPIERAGIQAVTQLLSPLGD